MNIVRILEECKEMVECWGDYAPPYFKEKHNLAEDLDKLDKWIEEFKAIGGWYCLKCEQPLAPECVTNEERCTFCGSEAIFISNDNQEEI